MADIPDETATAITEALLAGNKDEAVKLYKEVTGESLKTSKMVVEELDQGIQEARHNAPPAGAGDSGAIPAPTAHVSGDGNLSEHDAADITEVIFHGQKSLAIKLYQEAVGCGQKDAKKAVDALEEALRLECPERFPKRFGCASAYIVGGLLAALLAGAMGHGA